DDDVAVGLDIDHDVADRRGLFLGRSRFRNFHVELVLGPRRVPSHEKENEQQEKHVDERRQLDARMLRGGVPSQIHITKYREQESGVLTNLSQSKFIFE